MNLKDSAPGVGVIPREHVKMNAMSQDVDRIIYWMLKNVNRAIREYQMIADGERVAVAVSGGKDSLSLLRLLDARRKSAGERYEMVAIHVLADARGPETPPHQPLFDWLAASGYPYSIERLALPEGEELPMGCQRCTWNRRRTLFEAAQRLGCSVVAMGHTADDLAQTTLLNVLFHGRVETMTPRREYFGGAIRLIRPLCYTPESDTRRLSRAAGFPPSPPDCEQSKQSQRQFVRDVLRQAARHAPQVKENLLRAGLKNSQP